MRNIAGRKKSHCTIIVQLALRKTQIFSDWFSVRARKFVNPEGIVAD
jgi:hypothetical protein